MAAVNLPSQAPQPGNFALDPAFPNLTFSAGIFVSGVPGESRLVVVEQGGRVYAFMPTANVANGERSLVLDLSARVLFGGEEGLLGLAFDPDFVQNRYIYVHYSRNAPSPIGHRAVHLGGRERRGQSRVGEDHSGSRPTRIESQRRHARVRPRWLSVHCLG
ncbi:MAG: PQQ-dependent sugar dehydrogenase [Gammaproteobacteria bacterium]|nr:PQQ-dependent sugar dehydrogenase [Gammaproteobacteria bacterium]